MPRSAAAETDLLRLSELIAASTGLHFPRDRLSDLQYGMSGATAAFGFSDIAACVLWLLSGPLSRLQIDVLVKNLTIGQTYFFREKATLDVFASNLLPALIHSRRGGDQQLRLWSAACCTGEEAYSLAMILQQGIPDLAKWNVKILATDINRNFLAKAAVASYSAWACRYVPPTLKDRNFVRSPDGRYRLAPEIREMVTFAPLNLAEDSYPSRDNDTDNMDVIFCRNALIYLTPAHARKVIGNFHRALREGGWLAVSPSDALAASFSQFVMSGSPGATLFQKSPTHRPSPPRGVAAAVPSPRSRAVGKPPGRGSTVAPSTASPDPAILQARAAALYEQARYGEAVDAFLALQPSQIRRLPTLSLLVRALANQGRHAEALTWCDRWIAADKLDNTAHYLRAVILLEQDKPDEAIRSLRNAIYLQPDFALAHYTLGSLARIRGERAEAGRHFVNARNLLASVPPEELVREADGLTAGGLLSTIAAAADLDANQ